MWRTVGIEKEDNTIKKWNGSKKGSRKAEGVKRYLAEERIVEMNKKRKAVNAHHLYSDTEKNIWSREISSEEKHVLKIEEQKLGEKIKSSLKESCTL